MHTDLAYGEAPRQHLDIYAPKIAVNLPVVIFFYGGSWKHGNKENYRFVGAALAERGFVTVIAGLSALPGGDTFPPSARTRAHALAWVEAHAAGIRRRSASHRADGAFGRSAYRGLRCLQPRV